MACRNSPPKDAVFLVRKLRLAMTELKEERRHGREARWGRNNFEVFLKWRPSMIKSMKNEVASERENARKNKEEFMALPVEEPTDWKSHPWSNYRADMEAGVKMADETEVLCKEWDIVLSTPSALLDTLILREWKRLENNLIHWLDGATREYCEGSISMILVPPENLTIHHIFKGYSALSRGMMQVECIVIKRGILSVSRKVQGGYNDVSNEQIKGMLLAAYAQRGPVTLEDATLFGLRVDATVVDESNEVCLIIDMLSKSILIDGAMDQMWKLLALGWHMDVTSILDGDDMLNRH
jgi:hypothetical protein